MNTLGLIVLRHVKVTNDRYALEDYVKVDGKLDKNCSYESFESVYKHLRLSSFGYALSFDCGSVWTFKYLIHIL